MSPFHSVQESLKHALYPFIFPPTHTPVEAAIKPATTPSVYLPVLGNNLFTSNVVPVHVHTVEVQFSCTAPPSENFPG